MSTLVRSSFVLVLPLFVGCGAQTSAPPEGPSPTPVTSTSISTSAAAPPPPVESAAPATAAPSASAASSATAGPVQRHPRPTEAEWASAQTASATGAAELGCRFLTIHEWFRIECSPKTPAGKTLLDVVGGDYCWLENMSCSRLKDTAHTRNGTRSFEGLMIEGQRTRASFLWEDQMRLFEVRWPKGSPKPEPIAAFEAPDQIEKADGARYQKILACCQQGLGEDACTGQVQRLDKPECAKLIGNCSKYLACARGD